MHNVRMKPQVARGNESIWLVLQRDLHVWLRDVQEPTYLTMGQGGPRPGPARRR